MSLSSLRVDISVVLNNSWNKRQSKFWRKNEQWWHKLLYQDLIMALLQVKHKPFFYLWCI